MTRGEENRVKNNEQHEDDDQNDGQAALLQRNATNAQRQCEHGSDVQQDYECQCPGTISLSFTDVQSQYHHEELFEKKCQRTEIKEIRTKSSVGEGVIAGEQTN